MTDESNKVEITGYSADPHQNENWDSDFDLSALDDDEGPSSTLEGINLDETNDDSDFSDHFDSFSSNEDNQDNSNEAMFNDLDIESKNRNKSKQKSDLSCDDLTSASSKKESFDSDFIKGFQDSTSDDQNSQNENKLQESYLKFQKKKINRKNLLDFNLFTRKHTKIENKDAISESHRLLYIIKDSELSYKITKFPKPTEL